MGNKMPTFGLSVNGMSASSMKAEARSHTSLWDVAVRKACMCASSGFQTKLCGQSP